LEFIKKGDFYSELKKLIFAEPIVKLADASLIILITAIFERMLLKYGENGLTESVLNVIVIGKK
jgi:hypothetical protein